jgi:hypothetical protein
LTLSIFGCGQFAIAEDTPKPKAPAYITVGDVTGEISKVDTNSITIKVPKPPPPALNPKDKNYQQQMAQRAKLAADPKNAYTETKYEFAVDAQARIKHLPAKLDANGKKVPYTADEYKNLKGNAALPGWKADVSELKVGETVEAHVVQLAHPPKDSKVEYFVRWALILNDPPAQNPANPPKKSN